METDRAYRELGERLRARAARLSQRLEELQGDAGHLVPARGRPHAPLRELGPVLGSIVDGTRTELASVQDALGRLAAGCYGRCARCEGAIALERLRLLPEASECGACARRAGEQDADETEVPEGLGWVRREHAGLRFALAALRESMRALAGRWPEERSSDARAEGAAHRVALVLFADFRRELAEHFEREEQGGYMAEALAAAPQLAGRAELLCRQHDELAKELDRLFGSVQFARPHTAEWQRLAGELFALAGGIERHEMAESELVADALLDDVGAVD